MTEPLIIMSAPNGAKKQKSDHPDLPITPTDIARCAEEVVAAGASILHLHVRDANNQHTLDVDRYRAAISAIRDAVGNEVIIQATSESVGMYSSCQQMQMVRELKPEAVSLALRELCPKDQNIPEAAKFFNWLQQERIFPQYILYDQEDLQRFEVLRKQGVFAEDHPFVLLVIGRNPLPPSMSLIESKANVPWAKCGFGSQEMKTITHATQNNGHVRVGFENNIYWNNDSLLTGHDQMIKYCAQQAKLAGRELANADLVRKIFSLS